MTKEPPPGGESSETRDMKNLRGASRTGRGVGTMLTASTTIPIERSSRAGSSVVEHVTFNHVVEGSIPSPLTTIGKGRA